MQNPALLNMRNIALHSVLTKEDKFRLHLGKLHNSVSQASKLQILRYLKNVCCQLEIRK